MASSGIHTHQTGIEFVHPMDKYRCPVCSYMLQCAVQTPCGHRMCGPCLQSLLAQSDSVLCPVGDPDCEMLSRTVCFPDFSVRRDMASMLVYCSNKYYGCQQQIKLKDLQAHTENCKFTPISCTNMECEAIVGKGEMQQHLAEECSYQPRPCNTCNQTFNAVQMVQHLKADCPEMESICRYGCGLIEKREVIQGHEIVCRKKPIVCKFQVLGCAHVCTQEIMEEHLKMAEPQHLEMVTLKALQIEAAMKELQQVHMQAERKAAEAEKKAAVADIRLAESNLKISQLSSLVEKIQEQIQKVNDQHERQLTLQDVRLAESDLRFQILETASYDGVLLWKIRDYNRRRSEAVAGRILSLYSQPFYTSRHGYKMCARIYLNGEGMGQDTHLSLFFVMMRGECDALLHWPFQQKVTFLLLNQESKDQHIVESFRPDPTSSSFQRPASDMNVASGCPLFVPQDAFSNPAYIKDDTIFVKVIVDTEGLVNFSI